MITTINAYDENNNITCTEVFNNGRIIKRITGDFVEEYIRDKDGIIIEYKSNDGYRNNLRKESINEVIEEFENNKSVICGGKKCTK